MGPSVVFMIHDDEKGVCFSPIDAVSLQPVSIEWDEKVFPELVAIPGYSSVEINDEGELVLGYVDDEVTQDDATIAEEVERGNLLVAKAAGKEMTDVEFVPCPCLVFGMLESVSLPLIFGAGGGPQLGFSLN